MTEDTEAGGGGDTVAAGAAAEAPPGDTAGGRATAGTLDLNMPAVFFVAPECVTDCKSPVLTSRASSAMCQFLELGSAVTSHSVTAVSSAVSGVGTGVTGSFSLR